jgi:hypothetical protein
MQGLKKVSVWALAAAFAVSSFSGCKPKVEGCTDPTSTNYNPEATEDNGSCTYAPSDVTANITANTTWVSGRTYILKNFVHVVSGVTLTIEPGVIVRGDKDTKGTLIIDMGAKIMAEGTAEKPIVFTSNLAKGARNYGDWGGIILCGKAPVNLAGGTGVVEGGTGATYGGTDAADNSGVLKYVRIEFAGIPFQPNQEINGLTCAGVGSGTTIDYIQVSYSGDDSYEFFGGSVNIKHLIAFKGLDDDFDTDNGFSGKAQFLVSLRDPNKADVSGSNGFESDNDATGSTATPTTSAVFSNVSIFGPKATSATTIDGNFKRGAHLRRSTKQSIFNSLIAGFPVGLYVDGANAAANATNGDLVFQNNLIAGCTSTLSTNDSTFNLGIQAWFDGGNNTAFIENAGLSITDAFNFTSPNFLPSTGSPALSGAAFTHAKLAGFENVSYRGAFGSTNWTEKWANWDPQNTDY